MIKKFVAFVTSRSTALVILILITFLLICGSLLPDPSLLTSSQSLALKSEKPLIYFAAEKISLQRIVSSYFFILLSLLLLITTVSCSVRRMIILMRKANDDRKEDPDEGNAKHKVSRFFPSTRTNEVERLIQSSSKNLVWPYNVRKRREEKHILHLAVGRGKMPGEISSIIFHWALVMGVLSLVTINISGFIGQIVLGEGQELPLTDRSFVRVVKEPRISPASFQKDITLRLVKFEPLLFKGIEKQDAVASIRIDNSNRREKIRLEVNKPLHYAGFDFILKKYGFSPRFVIESGEQTVMDSHINLQEIGQGDSFVVPGSLIRIEGILFSDFKMIEGKPRSLTYLPKKPVFKLSLFQEDKKLYEGLLKKGHQVRVGRYSIKFADLKYWILLDVVGERGNLLFYISCALLTIALTARFLLAERRISINLTQKKNGVLLQATTTSSLFGALFDEKVHLWLQNLESLVSKKKKALK